MNKTKNNESGFTLAELLLVIAIIFIMVAVVFAMLRTARQKAEDTYEVAQLDNFRLALETFYRQHKYYPMTSSATTTRSIDGVDYNLDCSVVSAANFFKSLQDTGVYTSDTLSEILGRSHMHIAYLVKQDHSGYKIVSTLHSSAYMTQDHGVNDDLFEISSNMSLPVDAASVAACNL